MSFIKMIKSCFSSTGGSSNRAYVVDAARLVDEKTGRRMAPRDQVQMLNALARVSKQEGLVIQAVIESDRPLREVEHGAEFNGVKVFYAPDTEQLVALALKLCRKSGGALVSSGVTMESRATEAGIPVLCSSTFRKAFLQGGMSGGDRGGERRRGGGRDRRGGRGDRGDRGDRGGRGGRGGRDRKGSSRDDGGKPQSNGDQAPKNDEHAAVRNLIDLVE
jgi:hypothetical protein